MIHKIKISYTMTAIVLLILLALGGIILATDANIVPHNNQICVDKIPTNVSCSASSIRYERRRLFGWGLCTCQDPNHPVGMWYKWKVIEP